MAYALPLELWQLIAASLSRSDLAHLSCTSSRFLRIFRSTLYRTVDLTAGIRQPDPSYALALLARDEELAKSVVKLSLDRPFSRDSRNTAHSLINPDALANLVSLRRIVIRGCVFLTPHEQHEFGRVLAGIPLEDLIYFAHSFFEKWPSNEMGGIRDLKRLTWATQNSRNHIGPMWDILSCSRTTIHTLSLLLGAVDELPYFRLWNMHFPHLRSLTLGIWDIETEVELAEAPDFTDFILTHNNTIEELNMEYEEYSLQFNESALTRLGPDSLPHLRAFKGNSSSFKIMAQARMKCLTTTLRRLVVDLGGVDDPARELQWMFDAILSPVTDSSGTALGGLPALIELDLDFSRWDNPEWTTPIVEAIRRCAECCGPSLEVWIGTLPDYIPMDAEELGELFGLFRRLKVIDLPMTIIPQGKYEGDEGDGTEYVRILASKCLALERVYFTSRFSHPPIVVWEVMRDRTSESSEGSVYSIRRVPA